MVGSRLLNLNQEIILSELFRLILNGVVTCGEQWKKNKVPNEMAVVGFFFAKYSATLSIRRRTKQWKKKCEIKPLVIKYDFISNKLQEKYIPNGEEKY